MRQPPTPKYLHRRADFMAGEMKTTLLIIWAATVAAGMAGLVRYQTAPGALGATVAQRWPDNAGIARDPSSPTLVLMLHPHCPCSVATLNELAVLMSRVSDRLTVDIFFVDPARAPKDWVQGDLWRKASAMPGVHVAIDADAKEAHAFGATTSGDASLYSAAGDLLFKGGITDSRGHEGDNAGLAAIVDLVSGRQPAVRRTSVFGCPLED
jgi:hypothetical protein